MNVLLSILRYTWATAWYAFAVSAVFFAVLFSAARLLLPQAENYRVDIEERVSQYIGQPARVAVLDAEWQGLEPLLVLKDVTLLDTDGETAVLDIQKIRFGLDLLASALSGKLVFSGITLVGVDLTLMRFADGRIAMQGLAARGGDQNLTKLTKWLFSQGELRLEDSSLTWFDQRSTVASRLNLADVNIGLRNRGKNHWLDISLSLPEAIGQSLHLLVDMYGNPLDSVKGRRTRVYVSGESVNVTRLFAAVGAKRLLGLEAGAESADFQLWADWRDGSMQDLKGQISLDAMYLAVGDDASLLRRNFEKVAGQFALKMQADAGWQFEAENLLILRDNKFWLPSRLSLSYAPGVSSPEAEQSVQTTLSALSAQQDAVQSDAQSVAQTAVQTAVQTRAQSEDVESSAAAVAIAVDFVRLDVLSDLLPLAARFISQNDFLAAEARKSSQDLLHSLQAIHPLGEVYDLRGDWQPTGIKGYARFENVSSQAWEKIPALSDASGQFWLNGKNAQLSIDRAALSVDLPKLFRDPLPFDYLSGQLAWQGGADGWHLMARRLRLGNQDIRARVTLDLEKTADHPSPFISLVGAFTDGNGSHTSRYLPVGILSSKTVKWLDDAILGGQVPSGNMLLHGRLSDFPFDAGNGRFEVRFAVEHAMLDYAPGWPLLSDIGGEVLFKGRSMEIKAERGKIFQSDVRWANIGIKDMRAHPAILTVRGDIAGPTQDKLNYLQQSPPLAKKFGGLLKTITAQGDSVLSLNLSLPLQQTQDTQVSGRVRLEDNAVLISPLGRVLTHANGTLNFSSDGLQAEAVTGDLLGQPVTLDIGPGPAGQTRLHATGDFDAADVSRRYLPRVTELLSGRSAWDITLDVPMGDAVTTKTTVLLAQSDMKGVEARLPSPLSKRRDEALPLALRVDFPPAKEPVLRLAYGGFLSGIFEFGEGGFIGLRRGELRLNQGQAVLPDQTGVRVLGWVDRFSLDDWSSILGAGGEGDAASWVLSTNLAVREAEVFGQKLHNLTLIVSPQEHYWQAKVESRELRGELQIPRSDRQRPLLVDLDYCKLDSISMGASSDEPLDPRDLPPMKVIIGDLQYKDYRYGSLHLETLPVHKGLKIKQLILEPKDTQLTVDGGWFVRGSEQYSVFDIQVESQNVEESLKAFGYVGSIAGGKGSARFDLQWPGSPMMNDERMGAIRGNVRLDIRKGQLLDIDPGAGRLFGLLSLQTLPRRLTLDFSDVFREGFRFDRIQGDFLVEDGDAYTSNLLMFGPAARVEITGRTGLVAKDYDQLVTVTPQISDTLPILGALAVAPAVGAALLVMQKLVEPQINKATQFQYSVTGPWSAPEIVKIKKPVPETDSFFDDE